MKTKQPRLPGTEDPEIEALEDLADDYMDARNKRQSHLKNEVELKNKILDRGGRKGWAAAKYTWV